MKSTQTRTIMEQIKALPLEQQVELAEAVDRLTWAHRWRAICERIAAGLAGAAVPSDDEIDAQVRAVRREKPLSERSSTHPF